jgi:hypothetical protein
VKAESVLTFAPDGTVRGLYTEAVPLHELGRLSVRRASTIEFDDEAQAWTVRSPGGVELYQSSSRQECLDWERDHFNKQENME